MGVLPYLCPDFYVRLPRTNRYLFKDLRSWQRVKSNLIQNHCGPRKLANEGQNGDQYFKVMMITNIPCTSSICRKTTSFSIAECNLYEPKLPCYLDPGGNSSTPIFTFFFFFSKSPMCTSLFLTDANSTLFLAQNLTSDNFMPFSATVGYISTSVHALRTTRSHHDSRCLSKTRSKLFVQPRSLFQAFRQSILAMKYTHLYCNT